MGEEQERMPLHSVPFNKHNKLYTSLVVHCTRRVTSTPLMRQHILKSHYPFVALSFIKTQLSLRLPEESGEGCRTCIYTVISSFFRRCCYDEAKQEWTETDDEHKSCILSS